MSDSRANPPAKATAVEANPPAWRTLLGGFLMGLANLVPGVSGGTMILALGLYDRFVGAVANATRLKLEVRTVVFLGLLAVGIATALLGASGLVVALVSEYRWAMYSLFIGLTLGGAPELWRLGGGARPAVLVPAAAGLAGMYLVATAGSAAVSDHWVHLLWLGALAASSMILPGISGAYVLLIFGMYETVVGAVSSSALRSDPGASMAVLVPVGIGAVLGIALLSNLLRWLLRAVSGPTHGFLLGLLLGSVLGLWPFQEPVHPDLAHPQRRKAVEALVLDGLPVHQVQERTGVALGDAEAARLQRDYRDLSKSDFKRLSGELRRTEVRPAQGALAVGLVVLGFLMTMLLARSSRRTG